MALDNYVGARDLVDSIRIPNNFATDALSNLSERVTVLKSELQQLNDGINAVIVNVDSSAVEDNYWSLAELNTKIQAISATGTDISSQQYLLNLSDLSSTIVLNLDSTSTSTTFSYDRSSTSTLGFNKVDITFNVATNTAISSAVAINIDESIDLFTTNTTDNITTYSTQLKPEEAQLGIEQVDVNFKLESTSITLTPDNMSTSFKSTNGIGFNEVVIKPELAELTITANNFVAKMSSELLASNEGALGYSKVILPGKADDINSEIDLALSRCDTIENATIVSTAIQNNIFDLTQTVNSDSVIFDATSEDNNNFIGPNKITIKNPDYLDVTLNNQAELIRVISSNSNLEQQYKTFQFVDDFACVRSFSVPKIPVLEQCIIDADTIRNNIKSGNASYTYSIYSAYTNKIQINLPNLATLSSNDSTYLEYVDANTGLVTVGIEATGINDYYNNPITNINAYQYTADDAESTNETAVDRYTSCTLIDSTISTVLQHTNDIIDTYNFSNTQYQLYSFLYNPLQKHRIEFTVDASAATEVELYCLVQIDDNTTTKTKLFTFKKPEAISIDHTNKKIAVDSIQTYTFTVDSIAGFYSSREPIPNSMLFENNVHSTGIKCIISTKNEESENEESVELIDQDLYNLLTDMPNIEDLPTLEGLLADSIITSHYYIVTNRSNLIDSDIPTDAELQDIILTQTPKSISYVKDANGLLVNEIEKCLYVPLDIFQTDENGTLALDEYGNPKLILEETKMSIPKSFSDTLSDGTTKINYVIDDNSIKLLTNSQAVICQAEVSIELLDATNYVIDEIDKQVEVLFYTQANEDSEVVKMKYYQPAIQIINNETEI